MFTVIGTAIGLTIAIGTFLAIAMRHDKPSMTEQRRVIVEFQDILNHRLKEHNPRVQVSLANGDMKYRPNARIVAHGHIFTTKAGNSTEEMRAKADEAADFFAKKQLRHR